MFKMTRIYLKNNNQLHLISVSILSLCTLHVVLHLFLVHVFTVSYAEIISSPMDKVAVYNNFKGVTFYDLSCYFEDPLQRNFLIEKALNILRPKQLNAVAAIDSRGYIYGGILADRLEIPLILIRKGGKLPSHVVHSEKCKTEYSDSVLEVRKASVCQDMRVVIFDDVYASGGSMNAAERLLTQCNATVACKMVILNISENDSVESLIQFKG
ncbi:hypothetical protein P9112_002542 [Eukaryota sp. TZLM1-RC]